MKMRLRDLERQIAPDSGHGAQLEEPGSACLPTLDTYTSCHVANILQTGTSSRLQPTPLHGMRQQWRGLRWQVRRHLGQVGGGRGGHRLDCSVAMHPLLAFCNWASVRVNGPALSVAAVGMREQTHRESTRVRLDGWSLHEDPTAMQNPAVTRMVHTMANLGKTRRWTGKKEKGTVSVPLQCQ